MSHVLIAAIQLCSGPGLAVNLDAAEQQLRKAAAAGARLAVLPENFAVFDAVQYREVARQLPSILTWLAALARELDLWIVAGTLPAASRPDGALVPDGRVRTACHVISATGECVARYDKIHLFDVDVPDSQGAYRESATFEPGDEVVCVETPFGCIGLTICYDLRFPELFRALVDMGAGLVSVPAAFTAVTGEAHWQVLLRARAIENQVMVVGAGQGGRHNPSRQTWGHTQIIDAWGRVLAEQVTDGAGFVLALWDRDEQVSLQNRMPVRKHRLIR